MTLPLQPFLFCLPSAVYVLVWKLRRNGWQEGVKRVGWSMASPKYLAVGPGLGLLTGVLLLGPGVVEPDVLDRPGIAQSQYAGRPRTLGSSLLVLAREAVLSALGEEVLFRGFPGGLRFRRPGFVRGNLLQTGIFVLPHMCLLAVRLRLWPLLLAQYAAGWLFGGLLHKSDSILPGWLAHSAGNAFGALAFMR